jgi:hypothetical protein
MVYKKKIGMLCLANPLQFSTGHILYGPNFPIILFSILTIHHSISSKFIILLTTHFGSLIFPIFPKPQQQRNDAKKTTVEERKKTIKSILHRPRRPAIDSPCAHCTVHSALQDRLYS